MKAALSNYRQSPRKVRLIADLVRGRNVNEARVLLAHTPKRAAVQMIKLIDSAVANAVNNDKHSEDTLFIAEIRVDEGFTLKRIRPVSRGSAHPINKRTSHVSLTLGSTESPKKVVTKTKKAARVKKTTKKASKKTTKKATKKAAKKATKKSTKKTAKKTTN